MVLPENGCTIIGHLDLSLVPAHAPEDLVHSPWAKSGLDEVADGHGADKGRETSNFSLLFVGLMFHNTDGVEGNLLKKSENVIDSISNETTHDNHKAIWITFIIETKLQKVELANFVHKKRLQYIQ